jgi:hypothetical protein
MFTVHEGCAAAADDEEDVLLNFMYSWHWVSSWFGCGNMAF